MSEQNNNIMSRTFNSLSPMIKRTGTRVQQTYTNSVSSIRTKASQRGGFMQPPLTDELVVTNNNTNNNNQPSKRPQNNRQTTTSPTTTTTTERPTLSQFFTSPKRNSGGSSSNNSNRSIARIRTLTAMGVFSQVQKCENNWREKVNQFAQKTEEKDKMNQELQRQGSFLKLNEGERKHRIKKLFKDSYRRHHPRRVILDFFNDVAREGAHEVETKGKIETYECLHPMLRYFNRASVFTVWRPTSMDAIVRMIRCEAVGKGLDIKAKSARRGKLSGYVPFLQISGNDDKDLIKKEFPKDGTVRVFFKRDEREEAEMVRAKAITILELVAHEILNMMDIDRLSLALSLASDEETQARILEELNEMTTKVMDLAGYSITLIDDYAPRTYGLEIPMLLFWEAFIVRQDLTCEKGSPFDIGRESCPRNQNLNISSVVYNNQGENKSDTSEHRIVILQTAGLDSPMNPFELLMSYEMEESKEVLPVVSDCDCFLVGTRRVTYRTPMDPEQVEVMKWCISEINKILETTSSSETETDDCTWAEQWGSVLERAKAGGFEPKIPNIGFGDPKSCSIMENAVNRLIGEGSGGVRHGAECFNYHFPQELEDEYIIIADCLPGDQPWIKVNLDELHDFLDEKISCSYTFPLNPKWILCDGGRWRDHYDKLMAFENETVQESMNVWFPQDCGIRERIDAIRDLYPHGYCPGDGGCSDEESAAAITTRSRSRSIGEEVCFNSNIILPSPSGNRGFWSPKKKGKQAVELPTIDSLPGTPCSLDQVSGTFESPSLLVTSSHHHNTNIADASPDSQNSTTSHEKGGDGFWPPFHPELSEQSSTERTERTEVSIGSLPF